MNITLNNSHHEIDVNYVLNNKDIVIGIDSSKTNTGVYVSTPTFDHICEYEISGAGSDNDLWDLCALIFRFVQEEFKMANIVKVGIESPITKNSEYGMKYHMSRVAITSVYAVFKTAFKVCYGITPEDINNQTWKEHTLPKEYRTRKHYKGSKDYLADTGHRLGSRSDDICDAYFITKYICENLIGGYIPMIKDAGEAVPLIKPEEIQIVSLSEMISLVNGASKAPQVGFNPDFGFDENYTFARKAYSKKEHPILIAQLSFEDFKVEYSDYVKGKIDFGDQSLYIIFK